MENHRYLRAIVMGLVGLLIIGAIIIVHALLSDSDDDEDSGDEY